MGEENMEDGNLLTVKFHVMSGRVVTMGMDAEQGNYW